MFLVNGNTRIIDLKEKISNDNRFHIILNNDDFFNKVEVQSLGMGIKWGENLIIGYDELFKHSDIFGISIDVFNKYAKRSYLETSDVCQELNCSRKGVLILLKEIRLNKFERIETMLFLQEVILIYVNGKFRYFCMLEYCLCKKLFFLILMVR